VANNNYPQITSVTSETLQAQIRNLLPSQEGFGTDLMAQNVIVPIIDLTAAAEGSTVPQNLQTAIAFGSQTAFAANNSTVVVANTTGFWRIFGTSNIMGNAGGVNYANSFTMTDGLSTKTIWGMKAATPSSAAASFSNNFDFVVFLAASISISAVTNNAYGWITGSARQIADINGNLVNPSGFSPQ